MQLALFLSKLLAKLERTPLNKAAQIQWGQQRINNNITSERTATEGIYLSSLQRHGESLWQWVERWTSGWIIGLSEPYKKTEQRANKVIGALRQIKYVVTINKSKLQQLYNFFIRTPVLSGRLLMPNLWMKYREKSYVYIWVHMEPVEEKHSKLNWVLNLYIIKVRM